MTAGKRQIVMYSNDSETPADLAEGEVIPVVRGDGPRKGDLMGRARVSSLKGGELKLAFLESEEQNA